MQDDAQQVAQESAILHKARSLFHHKGARKYLKNISWSLIGRFATLAISFFVSAYVTKYLGPANYGMLSYTVSFVSIFIFISSLGIETILYRSLIEAPERRAVLMGTALRLKLVAGIVAMAASIGLASIFRTGDITFMLICILSITYLLNAWQIISYEFQADVQQKIPALISLAIAVILNCLKLAVAFFDKGVIYLTLVLVLESILYVALYIWFRKPEYGPISKWTYDKALAKQMLRESWPLIFSSGFVLIYTRIDQIILKHFLDNTAVGLYDSAVRLAEAWHLIPVLIISTLFPAIVHSRKHSWTQYKSRVIKLALAVAALSFVASVFVHALAPFIINLLYGQEFLGNISVLRIYMWSGVWMAIGGVVHHILILNRSTATLALINLGAMVLNVILNIILIPLYGINGAAIATAISYALLAFPIFFVLRKDRQAAQSPENPLSAAV